MTHNFHGHVTLDDYVRFNEFVRKKGRPRKTWAVIFLILLAALVVLNISRLTSGDPVEILAGVLTIVLAVLLWTFLMYLATVFHKKSYAKHYESSKNLAEEQWYCVDEREITVRTESSSTTLTKERIHKIATDEDTVYIFTAMNVAIIIKARYFQTRQEYDDVRDFIVTHYVTTG